MSGREERWADGSFRLVSELEDHTDGKLTCGSEVQHELRFGNFQLCDLRVQWTAKAEQPMLSYAGSDMWTDGMRIPGDSKPRRKRKGERATALTVNHMPSGRTGTQYLELSVTMSLQVLDGQGRPQGAAHRRWTLTHQLELQ